MSLDDIRRQIESAATGAEADELAWAHWREWMAAGQVEAGRAVLAGVLARDAPPSGLRARVLYADGLLAFRQGDQAASRARNEAALEMAQEVRDSEAESLALVGLSRIALRDGRYRDVVELASKARSLVTDAAAQSVPLHMEAAGTRLLGDYERAQDLYEERVALARSVGDDALATSELHNLMHVALHRGDVERAESLHAEWRSAVAGSQNPYDLAMRALDEAALVVAHGDAERARPLLDEAERTLADAGIALDPDDAFELQSLREALPRGD